jgi:hypothetical protein
MTTLNFFCLFGLTGTDIPITFKVLAIEQLFLQSIDSGLHKHQTIVFGYNLGE